MIDEYPDLFVAAAFAQGRTVRAGRANCASRNRTASRRWRSGLTACGMGVEEVADGLTMQGSGGEPLAGRSDRSRRCWTTGSR